MPMAISPIASPDGGPVPGEAIGETAVCKAQVLPDCVAPMLMFQQRLYDRRVGVVDFTAYGRIEFDSILFYTGTILRTVKVRQLW